MKSELQKALMPPVEIRDDLASFTVVFRRRRAASEERYRTARDSVNEILCENESVSTAEVIERTGLSRTAVQNAINELITEETIERTKPPRSPRQRYRRR